MDLPSRQLLVFRFGPGASFEGGLLGAAERIESGMSLRVLDVLLLRREPESGELEAMSTRGGGASGVASAVLDFRLDATARRATSVQTLAECPELADLGATLAQGEAVVAFLLEHRWAQALSEAVDRMGGIPSRVEFVEESSLRQLMPTLIESQ
jgi:hypothetical protein